ncbi:MAG: dTMP kinase [Thermoplasmata archaeon]
MKPKYRFITFEGIDGSGKSTLAKIVYRELKKRGVKIKSTVEPTDSWLGKTVKRGFNSKTDSLAETFLFLADRSLHAVQIKKWLSDGNIVLCDRYHDSTVAYQSVTLGEGFSGSGIDVIKWLLSFEKLFPRPDITFLLTIEPKKALSRLTNRKGKTKFEKIKFLQNVQKIYLKIAERNKRIVVLDASKPIYTLVDEVSRKIAI